MNGPSAPIEKEANDMNLCPHTEAASEKTARIGGTNGELGQVARRWQRLAWIVTDKNMLSLFDQAVVSATNFGTTILIGRACIPAELGVYSLAFTILVLWAAVEETLVVYPYAMQRTRFAASAQSEYAGAVLVLYMSLALTAVSLLAVSAAVIHRLSGDALGLGAALGVVVCIIPFTLLRELGRRMAIAHLLLHQALRLDITVALLQLAALLLLTFTNRLSAATAYAAVGLACAVGGALWLREFRAHFTLCHGRRLWRLAVWNLWMGKWIFLTQMIVLANAYFIQWVVAWVCGDAAVGVYAACITVVMLTNPFILGISNVLVPRAALSFAEGGISALRTVVMQSALILGTVMGLFCVGALCLNEQMLGIVFRRIEYQGCGSIVAILAFGVLAHALCYPALNGLMAIGRSDLCFRSGVLIFVLGLVTIPFLVTRWQVWGAAWGFLAGQVVTSATWWAAFLRLVPRIPSIRESQ